MYCHLFIVHSIFAECCINNVPICLWYIVYLSTRARPSKALSRWLKLQHWTFTDGLSSSNIGLLRWMQQRRLQIVDGHVELKLLNRDQCAPVNGSSMGPGGCTALAAGCWGQRVMTRHTWRWGTQTASPWQNVRRQTQQPTTSTAVKFVLWPAWGFRAVAVRTSTVLRESRQQGRTCCRLSSLPARTARLYACPCVR